MATQQAERPVEVPVETAGPPPPPGSVPDQSVAARAKPGGPQNTPGGLPAVPAAITAANTAVAAASGVAVAAGPVVLAAAAGGTAVAAVGAAAVRRVAAARRRAAARRGPGQGSFGRPLRRQTRASGGRVTPGALGGSGGGRSGRRSTAGTGSVGLAKPPRRAAGPGLSGVRQLRKQQAAADRGRSAGDRHRSGVGARRDVADARRAARERARQDRRTGGQGGGRGLLGRFRGTGRTGSGGPAKTGPDKGRASGGGRLRSARARLRAALRRRCDQGHQRRADRTKTALKTLAARRRARRRLAAAWLRYRARTLGALVLAAPVGVLGMVTSPIGRRLGWRWLVHPGRRLYRRLAGGARAAYKDRIADSGREPREIDGRVKRAPRNHKGEGSNVSNAQQPGPGFMFSEAAAEMEAAAQSYDPEGMMQVLQTCESMPEALNSVAKVFQILAERSDSEFPLEKEVGEALSEVYTHLGLAIAAAESVGTTFRTVHEQDIRRHEAPRNGDESGWDTVNN